MWTLRSTKASPTTPASSTIRQLQNMTEDAVMNIDKGMIGHNVREAWEQNWCDKLRQQKRGESLGDSEQRCGSQAHAEEKEVAGRHSLQTPVIEPNKETKLNGKGTVLGRTLWTAVRQAQALMSDPLQPHLVQQLRKASSRGHPALTHGPCCATR